MAPLNPARYEELQDAEDIINYMFAEPSLLHEALQASGCESPDGNKRLALVGDAVLKLVLVAEGHDRDEPRGMYTILTDKIKKKPSRSDQAS